MKTGTNYTYDDFLKAMKNAGLSENNFSAADLEMAKKDPAFGISIVGYKDQYAKAETEEQRALYNEAANALRRREGNYSGGIDGSEYLWQGSTAENKKKTADRIGNYLEFDCPSAPEYGGYGGQKPAYENRYSALLDSMIEEIADRPDFEYDHRTDPSYQAYAKQYRREGQRAAENALASAAAATGGQVSSWAQTAASQAGDYYGAKLSDKIPELYEQAYQRYLREFADRLSALSAVSGQEQLDYKKYLDALEQYNADRKFDYQDYLTRLGQYNTDRGFAYDRYGDDYERLGDYYSLLSKQDQSDYDRLLDSLSRREDGLDAEWKRAAAAAEIGDLGPYQRLGVDTAYGEALNDAVLDAKKASAAKTAAAASKTSGTGSKSGGAKSDGSDAGGDDGYISAYQQMFDADITSEDEAYAWLLANGYGVSASGKLAGYYQNWLESGDRKKTGSGSGAASPAASGGFDPDRYSPHGECLYSPGSAPLSEIYSAAGEEYNGAVNWLGAHGMGSKIAGLLDYAGWLRERGRNRALPANYPDYLREYVGSAGR